MGHGSLPIDPLSALKTGNIGQLSRGENKISLSVCQLISSTAQLSLRCCDNH